MSKCMCNSANKIHIMHTTQTYANPCIEGHTYIHTLLHTEYTRIGWDWVELVCPKVH